MRFRLLLPSDERLLRQLTYLAVHVPQGQPVPPVEIVDTEPLLRLCWEAFGTQAGDVGVCALEGDDVVGAAWARQHQDPVRGYGYVDDETPEIDLAVVPAARGRGVGTALLDALLAALRDTGRTRASLSVDQDNRARSLYERAGFVVVAQGDTDLTMVATLAAFAP